MPLIALLVLIGFPEAPFFFFNFITAACVQVTLVVGESREKKKISTRERDGSCAPVVTVVPHNLSLT